MYRFYKLYLICVKHEGLVDQLPMSEVYYLICEWLVFRIFSSEEFVTSFSYASIQSNEICLSKSAFDSSIRLISLSLLCIRHAKEWFVILCAVARSILLKDERFAFQISSASRREVREAFLRGETTKYDPTLRENVSTKADREKDKERQLHLSHHATAERTGKAGPKEIIAEGYVGFVNLPNQVYRKAVKRGFEFTLMVVGKCAVFVAGLTPPVE